MWTIGLVITLYNSVWCIYGHIQRFMQYNVLFPKVASASQCAKLWRDVWYALVRWLCRHTFRTFQAYNALWHHASWVVKFIRNATNIFIFHLTQSFRPDTQGASYNRTKSPTAQALTSSNSGLRPRHSSPKRGWKHENDFIVMGNVHLFMGWIGLSCTTPITILNYIC